jgi:hypothetical protein
MRGPRKPLHPLVTQALMTGLHIGARAAARAVDSLLKDAAAGLGAAEDRVHRTRRNIKRKVKDSGVSLDDTVDTVYEDEEE